MKNNVILITIQYGIVFGLIRSVKKKVVKMHQNNILITNNVIYIYLNVLYKKMEVVLKKDYVVILTLKKDVIKILKIEIAIGQKIINVLKKNVIMLQNLFKLI